MPLAILKRRGIGEGDGLLMSLNVEPLTYEQRAESVVCEQKLGEFVKRRGMATWNYRPIPTDPVPGDVRYRVLAKANGRRALYGATSKQRRIEFDHIVPRSLGGSNNVSNLQALCDECNRGKSNNDSTKV
jgi:ATP adenylyltransferase